MFLKVIAIFWHYLNCLYMMFLIQSMMIFWGVCNGVADLLQPDCLLLSPVQPFFLNLRLYVWMRLGNCLSSTHSNAVNVSILQDQTHMHKIYSKQIHNWQYKKMCWQILIAFPILSHQIMWNMTPYTMQLIRNSRFWVFKRPVQDENMC